MGSIVAMLMGLFGLTATTASADTSLCGGSDYTTCINAGYTDDGFGAHNSTSYWGAFAGHNCTDYAAFMEQTVNGAPSPGNNLGNAYQWAASAMAKGIPVNGTPAVGAVAQWNANSHGASSDGHVAYVKSVNSDGSITISEDSYPYTGRPNGWFDWKVIPAGAADWPNNFIHFKDIVAPGSGLGVGGLTATSPLAISTAGGAYTNAPVGETFTVQNTSGSTLTVASLILAVRDPSGHNYDQTCTTGLTLAAGAGYTCNLTQWWNSTGTYTVYPDWLASNGSWHAGALGSNQTFTLAAPGQLEATTALSISGPSGYFAGTPLQETFTVKNTTGVPLSVQALLLAVNDPGGTQYDEPCITSPMTLAAGASYTCNLTQSWGSTGTYSSVHPDWLDSSGNWHWGQLGGNQSFTLGATPAVIASSPLAISAPSGYHANSTLNETFTIKNTTASSLNLQALVLAFGDPYGVQYDEPCITSPMTLAAGASYTCTLNQSWASTGTYAVHPDWLDGAGNWHWGQLGPDQSFTLAA